MDKNEMVVLVILIVVSAGLLRTWIKARATAASAPARDDARLARLEERVRALETVVGDSSYELKQKLRELERS